MMRPLRIAVDASVLGRPLLRRLEIAADMGAGGLLLRLDRDISFDNMTESGRRQLLHVFGELNLGVSSLEVEQRRPLFELASLELQLDRLQRALLLAFQLKAESISFRIGPLPEDGSQEYETLCAALNELARHSNRVGSMPSVIVSAASAERIEQLYAQITAGPFGITLDPAVLTAADNSAAGLFRSLHHVVNHILVRDAVRDIDGTVTEVPVGRGDVAWEAFLSVLIEAEFPGWLSVVRTQGDDKPGDVSRAISYVRNVLMDR